MVLAFYALVVHSVGVINNPPMHNIISFTSEESLAKFLSNFDITTNRFTVEQTSKNGFLLTFYPSI
jgi:hypothetical protein